LLVTDTATEVSIAPGERAAAQPRIAVEVLVAFAVALGLVVLTTWPLTRHINSAARDTVDVPYEASYVSCWRSEDFLVVNDVRYVVVDRAAVEGTPWETLASPDVATDLLYRVDS
jgi:hypothetical protein